MQQINVLATITKMYSDLNHSGQHEIAMPLEFLYRRYQKADHCEKIRVFNDFTNYCDDYDLTIEWVYEIIKAA